MIDREEHGAEELDDADLDERGPILKVRTLACASNIYRGHDSDHHAGGESLSCGRNQKHFCKIFAENARESSHGAAGYDEKETPTIEKAEIRPNPSRM
jgi:hypothetical protein